MNFVCFCCGYTDTKAIRYPCPSCGIDISHLDGTIKSTFQARKWNQHLDLVSGNSINLYGKDWNCSFDVSGFPKIADIVKFTLNYGQRLLLPSNRGTYVNDVYLTFIPEIIGSGVSTHYATLDSQPCSGCCIISPQSVNYGHPFPILYDWVTQEWPTAKASCCVCGQSTHVGLTICWECYQKRGGDWTTFL
jgi:hypothetical protein